MDARKAGGPLGGGQLVAHAALGAPGTPASYHTVLANGKDASPTPGPENG
jgi:hypothetical protein